MIGRFLRGVFAGDGLRARAIRGSALTLSSFGGELVLRFISNLILTRLLFPEAFGLMALVQVVTSGLEMFSATGVRVSIIQSRRGDDTDFLNTAWMVQIVRGLLIWIATIALSYPMASFYAQPQLAQLIPVAGMSALIRGFTSTKVASSNRHLIIGRLTFLNLISQVVGIVAMVLLSLLLDSVWALVLGGLAGALVRVVLSHTILPGPRNRLAWEPEAFWELFHFGKYVFIGSVAGFLVKSGDRATLGKFVTLSELAVYNIAFMLASVPVQVAQKAASDILLPIYSRTRDDLGPAGLRKRTLARGLLLAPLVLSAIFLGLIGDWLIRALYSPEYHLAGPLLSLIALAQMPAIVTSGYGQYLLAVGRSGNQTIATVTQAVVQTVLLLVLISSFGLIGAIIALPLSNLLVYPLVVSLVHRHGGWEPRLDALLFALCGTGAALVLWIHDTAVAQILR